MDTIETILIMRLSNHLILVVPALLLIVFSIGNSCQAQIPTDSIVADFNEFVRLLEETHPDPYTNYGGKPFFRKAAMETRYALIQDSVTSADGLTRRIQEFLAPLHDGHTGIRSQLGSNDKSLVPIMFEAINDGIIIKRIPDEYKEMIGSRVLAIEGVPVKDVCDGLAMYFTSENEIGKKLLFCYRGMQPGTLRKVIPVLRGEYITYQVETPKGKHVDLRLPLIPLDKAQEWFMANQNTVTKYDFPNGDLTYDFVGKDKKTMYLRLHSIMARDCFKYMQQNGWDYEKELQQMYSLWGKEMPADPKEAISQLPSFSDEFEKMLQLMKQNGSINLIIDLRGNDGGWTPITLPTLYQLWGDQYLKQRGDWGIFSAKLISPLLLKKYNTSIEKENAANSTSFIMGDYFIEEEGFAVDEVTDEIRNKFINGCMSSVKDKLMAQQGQPVYKPKHVYVLTDPGTFSAAFHYAFFLWKMGATIVGVTSSQAPNTYMEVTGFELPRTGLRGSISNTLQQFLPVSDARSKDFTPDLMPTYEDYKRYNFDDNTIPMYLMDIINGNH